MSAPRSVRNRRKRAQREAEAAVKGSVSAMRPVSIADWPVGHVFEDGAGIAAWDVNGRFVGKYKTMDRVMDALRRRSGG